MLKKPFAKRRMASAVSLVLGSGATMPLYAQESGSGALDPVTGTPSSLIEEVVVTGVRSSLKRSMDVKRDSFGVVDAISAEDIGAFPDTNLAESLQRITGVSIDRQRGEGSEVTVRGFGGAFNLVTLNNRQMPTHGGTGRSFDFADIASDAVSGVEVYKTGRASVATGGIGATINIKTHKPFDRPGLQASFGAAAIYDTSNYTGDDYTPEVGGLISQTFFDDTVGILINGNYSKRDSGQAFAQNTAWLERDGAEISDNGQQTNLPGAGDIVALPQQIIYQVEDFSRERINGQITLQWRPLDTVEATLDYTYAELELDRRFNNMSIWFSPNGQSGTWSDGIVVSPEIYTETNNQPDFPMGAGFDAAKNQRDSLGFNLNWDPIESLTVYADYHQSTAERMPNSPYGSSAVVSISSFARQAATVDWRNDIPITSTIANDPLSPDDMQITGSVFGNTWAEMEIEQLQVGGQYRFNQDQTTIDFGISIMELDNFESSSNVQRNTWGQNQASAYGSIADLVVPGSLRGVYDEINGGEQVTNNFFLFDMQEVAQRAELLQNLPVGDTWHLPTANSGGDCGTGFCADSNRGFGNQLVEETDAWFVELTHFGEMFDMPFNVRVGYRYEETDVLSSAESETYTRIDWASTNEFTAILADDLIASGLEDQYDVSLPMMDFDIEIREGVKVRASYSQTIARSSIEDLRGNLSVGQVLRFDQGRSTADGTVGNPGLQPHESENWDFSAEWYYSDTSYVSAGYFSKSVENFVTDTEVEDVVLFPNLAHPALGPLYREAVSALGATATNGDIRDYIFTNFPNEPGVDAGNLVITGVQGRDDPAFYDVDSKVNSDDVLEIDGWEVAWQHDFGETGFGFVVNATFTSGDPEFNNNSDAPQFALPGLSDTRNFIAYYDKNGIQVRVAYNWRDDFFTGGVTQPSYTEEYEQWDVNASYEAMDGFIIFLEAINVTDESNRTFARDQLQLNFVGQTGPRFQGGFRYNF